MLNDFFESRMRSMSSIFGRALDRLHGFFCYTWEDRPYHHIDLSKNNCMVFEFSSEKTTREVIIVLLTDTIFIHRFGDDYRRIK